MSSGQFQHDCPSLEEWELDIDTMSADQLCEIFGDDLAASASTSSTSPSTIHFNRYSGSTLQRTPATTIHEEQLLSFTWPKLTEAQQYISNAEWMHSSMPIELETFPEAIVESKQLQNILHWSLGRLDDHVSADNNRKSLLVAADSEGIEPVTVDCQDSALSWTTNLIDGTVRTQSTTSGDTTQQEKPSGSASESGSRFLGDLVRKLSGADSLLSKVKKSPSGRPNEAFKKMTMECISCFDKFPVKDVLHLSCAHDYCKSCLHEVVLNALNNESAFPPKCCLTEMPLKTILKALNNSERIKYQEKAAEYAIPAGHRWYCPNTACTRWISPKRLHKDRRQVQTCPYCNTSICSHCRGLDHGAGTDCPEDFGLNSTLEIAEAEGWKRCSSCRTMVELSSGCHHMTCKCGYEFCYLCGARWGNCACTDAEHARRRLEAQNRRTEDQQRQQEEEEAAREEAEEIAEAIRQVEEWERQEVVRLAEEERRRQAEEERLLAQLEGERLQEEAAKQQAQLDAEQQYRQVLFASLEEECAIMHAILTQVKDYQQCILNERHINQEQYQVKNFGERRIDSLQHSLRSQEDFQELKNSRVQKLETEHQEELKKLTNDFEREEDDVFMQIMLHLRGKPNREERQKRMQDELRELHRQRQEDLKRQQNEDRIDLDEKMLLEYEVMSKTAFRQFEPSVIQFQAQMEHIGNRVGCDRQWFEFVTQRRFNMLKEHEKIMRDQLNAQEEATGLSRKTAAGVPPLLLEFDGGHLSVSNIKDLALLENECNFKTYEGEMTKARNYSFLQRSEDMYGSPADGPDQLSSPISLPLSRTRTSSRYFDTVSVNMTEPLDDCAELNQSEPGFLLTQALTCPYSPSDSALIPQPRGSTSGPLFPTPEQALSQTSSIESPFRKVVVSQHIGANLETTSDVVHAVPYANNPFRAPRNVDISENDTKFQTLVAPQTKVVETGGHPARITQPQAVPISTAKLPTAPPVPRPSRKVLSSLSEPSARFPIPTTNSSSAAPILHNRISTKRKPPKPHSSATVLLLYPEDRNDSISSFNARFPPIPSTADDRALSPATVPFVCRSSNDQLAIRRDSATDQSPLLALNLVSVTNKATTSTALPPTQLKSHEYPTAYQPPLPILGPSTCLPVPRLPPVPPTSPAPAPAPATAAPPPDKKLIGRFNLLRKKRLGLPA